MPLFLDTLENFFSSGPSETDVVQSSDDEGDFFLPITAVTKWPLTRNARQSCDNLKAAILNLLNSTLIGLTQSIHKTS